jgi:hypothetical protein
MAEQKKAANSEAQSKTGKSSKHDGKRMNTEIMKEFNKLNSSLKDLLYATKELEMNAENTADFLT